MLILFVEVRAGFRWGTVVKKGMKVEEEKDTRAGLESLEFNAEIVSGWGISWQTAQWVVRAS